MDKAFYKIFRRGNAAAVGKGKQAGFFQRSLLDEFRVTQHGIISEESPFGKALLGAKEGDTVTVEAPRGAITYTVQKIER